MSSHYQWDFSAIWPHFGLLLQGLLGTLQIGSVSLVCGVLAGVVLAWMRMSRWRSLQWLAGAVIGFYRNTPAIVHFFWIYYALPMLCQLTLSPFVAAVLALSAQSAAFYAEVFRGAIHSVDRGQWEGAKALGMRSHTALRRVILPQALRIMLPPFMERSFELVKSTALASSLTYAELLYQAMQINSQTFRPLEVYTVVAVMYFVLLFAASQAGRLLERRLQYLSA